MKQKTDRTLELYKRSYRNLLKKVSELEGKLYDELIHVRRMLEIYEHEESEIRHYREIVMYHKHDKETGRMILP